MGHHAWYRFGNQPNRTDYGNLRIRACAPCGQKPGCHVRSRHSADRAGERGAYRLDYGTGTKTWLRSRQTAATLLSLAAKGAIAIYPGPASLYGGVELTGLAAKTRPLALRAVSQMLSGSGGADLALWDQHLVYATAVGMSKRTLRELVKAYPQIQNPDWLDDNATDSLVYWNFRYASIGDTHDGSSRASTGDGTGLGFGLGPADSDHLGASFGGILDFGAQLGSGFNEISATIRGAAPASASIDGSSGSFSGGGSGGGSFGGR